LSVRPLAREFVFVPFSSLLPVRSVKRVSRFSSANRTVFYFLDVMGDEMGKSTMSKGGSIRERKPIGRRVDISRRSPIREGSWISEKSSISAQLGLG
jgi:hypothetical protein